MRNILLILCMLPLVMYSQTTVTIPTTKKEEVKVKKTPSKFMKTLKKEFKYSEYDLLLKSDLVKELTMFISVNKTRPMINITIAKDDTINGD